MCYIRAHDDSMVPHLVSLRGVELICERQDSQATLLHNIKGKKVVQAEKLNLDSGQFYPVRVFLTPTKNRTLYFENLQLARQWTHLI